MGNLFQDGCVGVEPEGLHRKGWVMSALTGWSCYIAKSTSLHKMLGWFELFILLFSRQWSTLDEVGLSECLRCNIKEKNSKMKEMLAFTMASSPPLTWWYSWRPLSPPGSQGKLKMSPDFNRGGLLNAMCKHPDIKHSEPHTQKTQQSQ